jgi:hypothetical protein
MKLRLAITIAIAIAGGIFWAPKGSASAPTIPAATPGITLSPAVVQTEIASTESEHQINFQITNNKPAAQDINISAADFNTLDESGGLVFVGTNPSKLQKKYGLASWISLPQLSITLAPKQTATITAIISNQGSLSPGGHYGALMLSLNDASRPGGSNKVAVHPIASSLLFVNKVGGDTHKLRLTDVNSSHSIFKLPSSTELRFYNDGNTHLIPRGTVEVTDPRGKIVAKGIINENSNLILPETYRRFSVPLNKISSPALPGKYKITVNFRFDGYDQFRSYQTSRFLLTPPLLVSIFIITIIIALLVVLLLSKSRQLRLGALPTKKLRKKSK